MSFTSVKFLQQQTFFEEKRTWMAKSAVEYFSGQSQTGVAGLCNML